MCARGNRGRASIPEGHCAVWFCALCADVWIAGGSPAAGYVLLSRQKNVTQEKATPFRRPPLRCGYPALLAKPGGCGTRPCGPQTVLADFPRLVCATRRRNRGNSENHPHPAPLLLCPGHRAVGYEGEGMSAGVGCGDEGTASFAIDAVRYAHRHPTAFGNGTLDGFPLLHRLVWPVR